jgi:hypothetical protein
LETKIIQKYLGTRKPKYLIYGFTVLVFFCVLNEILTKGYAQAKKKSTILSSSSVSVISGREQIIVNLFSQLEDTQK